MASTPLDARERVQICARFDELGPGAPTLCEGWTTFDLAAHLVVRERQPLASPGLVLGGPFADLTDRMMEREKRRGYAAVVERVRNGPPMGPFRVPKLREVVNLVEYVVHHEDVRRANAMGPRTGIDDVQDAVWRLLRTGSRLMLRKVPSGTAVELARPGGDVHIGRRGAVTARLTGDPVELLLWVYGRKQASQAVVDGDRSAVAALEEAELGI